MVNIFLFALGYILTLIGLTYTICYMNLLEIGYKTIDYVNFIIKRGECLVLPIGILLLLFVIIKGDD